MKKSNFLIYFKYFLLSIIVWQFSCGNIKTAAGKPKVRRVLILGNSITYHAPKPSIGWEGAWGMAASKKENDYVHLLTAQIKKVSRKCDVKSANIVAPFEGRFWNPNLGALDDFKNYKPDLIIFRIGDNVNLDSLSKHSFSQSLATIAQYIKDGRDVKICITSTFWPNPRVNQEIKKASMEHSWEYIDITNIVGDKRTMALNKFKNQGVAIHPSDEGMLKIEKAIWKAIAKFY